MNGKTKLTAERAEDIANTAYRLGYQDGFVDGRHPEGYDGDEREVYGDIDSAAMADGWLNIRDTISHLIALPPPPHDDLRAENESPPNDWLLDQARKLSSDKGEDAVRALAWNLGIAFKRWQAQAVLSQERKTK